MPTPRTYYDTQIELDAIKAMAFELLMSDEVTLDGPMAQRLSDHVFDMSNTEVTEAIRVFEEHGK